MRMGAALLRVDRRLVRCRGKGDASAMTVATTRFSGRAFSEQEMTLIGGVVRDCSGLSRMELARTVCELLRWRRPNGRLKARECREFLERLDADSALVLPAKRRGRAVGSVTRVPRTAAGEPGLPLVGSVRDVEPLDVELVRAPAQRLLFRELVGCYHYLGHTVPFGAHLRYLVFASRPQRAVVGCLLERSDSGAESAARGQQQLLAVAAVGRGEQPGQRRAGARPLAVGGGLAAPLPPGTLAGEDAGGPWPPPRGLLPRRQLCRVGLDQRSRSHGPARPRWWRGAQGGPGISCGSECVAAGPVAGANGVERSQRRVHERRIETTFGTVAVERVGYARRGHDSLHPLDAALNLPPERYSIEVRRRVAVAAASRSFDEALFDLSRSTGAEVPKRQAEQLVARAAEDFDAFYEARGAGRYRWALRQARSRLVQELQVGIRPSCGVDESPPLRNVGPPMRARSIA